MVVGGRGGEGGELFTLQRYESLVSSHCCYDSMDTLLVLCLCIEFIHAMLVTLYPLYSVPPSFLPSFLPNASQHCQGPSGSLHLSLASVSPRLSPSHCCAAANLSRGLLSPPSTAGSTCCCCTTSLLLSLEPPSSLLPPPSSLLPPPSSLLPPPSSLLPPPPGGCQSSLSRWRVEMLQRQQAAMSNVGLLRVS